MLSRTEAVIEAFVLTDREGRCFLIVEWAEAGMLAAFARQRDLLTNHIRQYNSRADIF